MASQESGEYTIPTMPRSTIHKMCMPPTPPLYTTLPTAPMVVHGSAYHYMQASTDHHVALYHAAAQGCTILLHHSMGSMYSITQGCCNPPGSRSRSTMYSRSREVEVLCGGTVYNHMSKDTDRGTGMLYVPADIHQYQLEALHVPVESGDYRDMVVPGCMVLWST